MREFEFEVRLCAHLENEKNGIVARQIGGGVHRSASRVLDVVVIEPGPEFDRRSKITDASIPQRAIHSRVGVGRPTRRSNAFDLPFETSARITERAVAVGFFERIRKNGSEWFRQTVRYPDWIGSVTSFENKPDLTSPGTLRDQLRTDVSLGLVDRVILATESHVTAAHLNRLPPEVGVWRIEPDGEELAVDTVREPTRLDVDGWGIELGERHPVERRIRAVSPEQKRHARVRLAERAYGKGWRSTLPGCEAVDTVTAAGSDAIPYCHWKDRVIDPGGCSPACPGFRAANPPSVDFEHERAERTAWEADPPGVRIEQVDLRTFGHTDQH